MVLGCHALLWGPEPAEQSSSTISSKAHLGAWCMPGSAEPLEAVATTQVSALAQLAA